MDFYNNQNNNAHQEDYNKGQTNYNPNQNEPGQNQLNFEQIEQFLQHQVDI